MILSPILTFCCEFVLAAPIGSGNRGDSPEDYGVIGGEDYPDGRIEATAGLWGVLGLIG